MYVFDIILSNEIKLKELFNAQSIETDYQIFINKIVNKSLQYLFALAENNRKEIDKLDLKIDNPKKTIHPTKLTAIIESDNFYFINTLKLWFLCKLKDENALEGMPLYNDRGANEDMLKYIDLK